MAIIAARPRPAERPDPSWKILLPLGVPFAVLLAVAVFAILSPYHPVGAPPPGQSGALVWGDGIFANKVELKAWLRLHGGTYRAWARQHPAAARLVTAPRRLPHAKVAATAHVKPVTKARPTKRVLQTPAKPKQAVQKPAQPVQTHAKPAVKKHAVTKRSSVPSTTRAAAAGQVAAKPAGSIASLAVTGGLLMLLLSAMATLIVRFVRGTWIP